MHALIAKEDLKLVPSVALCLERTLAVRITVFEFLTVIAFHDIPIKD